MPRNIEIRNNSEHNSVNVSITSIDGDETYLDDTRIVKNGNASVVVSGSVSKMTVSYHDKVIWNGFIPSNIYSSIHIQPELSRVVYNDKILVNAIDEDANFKLIVTAFVVTIAILLVYIAFTLL